MCHCAGQLFLNHTFNSLSTVALGQTATTMADKLQFHDSESPLSRSIITKIMYNAIKYNQQ